MLKTVLSTLKSLFHMTWISVRQKDPWRKRYLLTRHRISIRNTWKELKKKPYNRESVFGLDVLFCGFTDFRRLIDEIYGQGCYNFESKNASLRIIDCGANIGMSVLFFKQKYPQSSILAFEPHPKTYEILKSNLENNHITDVQIINSAVGGSKGEISFYTHADENNSVLAGTTPGKIPNPKEIKVSCVLLSDYIQDNGDIDLLKMDIEGSEHSVLLDLVKTEKLKRIRRIFLEYHHHLTPNEDKLGGFLTILEENGFGYRIQACPHPSYPLDHYQDLMIYAYQK